MGILYLLPPPSLPLSPAPSPATARPCCVTLLPQFSSPPSLPEPESGEMKATEPLSPTPTGLLLRPTELPIPPTLLPHTPLTPGLTSPPSSSLCSPSSASSSSSQPTSPSPLSGGRERPSRTPERPTWLRG